MKSRIFLLITIVLFTPIFSASADVSGRWSCHFDLNGSGDFPQDFLLAQNSSVISGQEVYSGTNTAFADITGSINGTNISMHMQYNQSSGAPGYYADVVGTVNGSSMSGTWSNASQAGGFSCSQTSGSGSNATPTPTPVGQSGLRPTATFVFCNRTGVGLSTADCSITVGDAGAPPRTMPTGTVKLTASGGFFPANGSCALQQSQYSPGVGACKVEFAIPFGYPIGVPFPIDAEYPGDSNFASSGTEHKNIDVACVGDSLHPCSGNVGFTFADWPQIYKNFVSGAYECGNYGNPHKSSPLRSIFGDIAKCAGNVGIDIKVGNILAGLDFSEIQNLAGLISNKDAVSDPVLKAIQALDDAKNLQKVQDSLNDAQKMNDLIQQIMKEQHNANMNSINNIRNHRFHTRAKKTILFVLGSSQISVKNNSVKTVKIRLSKAATKFVAALKKAGRGDIDATVTIKGSRGDGKKKFNKSYSVNFGINS